MSYKLFLDDMRNISDVTWVLLPEGTDWVVVRNYDEFVNTIQSKGMPEFITFDHDLSMEHYNPDTWSDPDFKYKEKTGLDCARWFLNYCKENNKRVPNYSVHSMNPVGRRNITDAFSDFLRNNKSL